MIFISYFSHLMCSIEVVRLLLEAGPKAAGKVVRKGQDWLPLHFAVVQEGLCEEVVHMLLDANPGAASAQVQYHQSLPLHLLVAHSHCSEGLVRRVIAAAPTVTEKLDGRSRLPLHVHCAQPKPSAGVVRALLDANPTAASTPTGQEGGLGMLPLHMVCDKLSPREAEPVVQLLLGSCPDAANVSLPSFVGGMYLTSSARCLFNHSRLWTREMIYLSTSYAGAA